MAHKRAIDMSVEEDSSSSIAGSVTYPSTTRRRMKIDPSHSPQGNILKSPLLSPSRMQSPAKHSRRTPSKQPTPSKKPRLFSSTSPSAFARISAITSPARQTKKVKPFGQSTPSSAAMLSMEDLINSNIELPASLLEKISKSFDEQMRSHEIVIQTSKNNQIANNYYGLNINQLIKWSRTNSMTFLSNEEARQERALSRMHGFMDAITASLKIQAWYRMIRLFRAFQVYRESRMVVKGRFLRAWKTFTRVQKMYYNQKIGKQFYAWRDFVCQSRKLSSLVGKFFDASVQKVGLNAQSVSLFFNTSSWGTKLSDSDSGKIRRLILVKLFRGWHLESRFQRMRAAKATQILSRMIRRSRGGLWIKEALQVCFHMWSRYSALRKATREGKPDPQYGYPYIPQWPILLKSVALKRAKKKRSAEIAKILQFKIWFDRWKHVKAMVDMDMMSLEDGLAGQHYSQCLSRKVFSAWNAVCRLKGKVFRNRGKYFYSWQMWAPRKKQLRDYKARTIYWMNNRRIRKCFDGMTELFRKLMARRVAAVREISSRKQDRKLLVCIYAVQGKSEQMFMLEYWRRWLLYRRNQQRWKIALLETRYCWYMQRNREIFNSWKDYSKQRKKMKLEGIPEDEASEDGLVLDLGADIPSVATMRLTRLNSSISKPLDLTMDGVLDQQLDLLTRHSSGRTEIASWELTDNVFRFACLMCHLHYSKQRVINLYMNSSTHDPRHASSNEEFMKSLQEKLDRSVESNQVLDAANAIEQGAVVNAHHVDVATRHLSDSRFLLAALLLSSGFAFIASCVTQKSREEIVMKCQSPLVAAMVSAHLYRWEKHQLASRELAWLSDDEVLNEVGTKYQGAVMWQAVAMLMVKREKENIKKTFTNLKVFGSVEDNNREIRKRVRAEKCRTILRNMANITRVSEAVATSTLYSDFDQDFNDLNYGNELFVKKMQKPKGLESVKMNNGDLSALINEFSRFMREVRSDAAGYRQPLLERDEILLKNGFLRQARDEFLSLREAYKTPAEKLREQAEKEMQDKARWEAMQLEAEQGVAAMVAKSYQPGARRRSTISVNPFKENRRMSMFIPAKQIDLVTIDTSTTNQKTTEASLLSLEEGRENMSFENRSSTLPLFFLESYFPHKFNEDEDEMLRPLTKQKLKNVLTERRVIYCRLVLGRVMKFMNSYGIAFPIEQRKSGYISSWVVMAFLQNSQLCPQSSKAWNLLPAMWWDPQIIIYRLDREINLIVSLIEATTDRINGFSSNKRDVEKRRARLTEFISKQYHDIYAVAAKYRDKLLRDEEDGIEVNRKVSYLNAQVTRLRNQIRVLKDQLKASQYMCAAGNMIGVFESFEESPDDKNVIDALLEGVSNETIQMYSTTGSATLAKKKLEFAASRLIDNKKDSLAELEENLASAIISKRIGDMELSCFKDFCNRSNTWLQHLSKGKLLMVLDAQEIHTRESENADELKRSLDKDKKYLELLQKDLRELRVQQEFMMKEGRRIEMIAEEARFEDLMRRKHTKNSVQVNTKKEIPMNLEITAKYAANELVVPDMFPEDFEPEDSDIFGVAAHLTASDIAAELLPPSTPGLKPKLVWNTRPEVRLNSFNNDSKAPSLLNMEESLRRLAMEEIEKERLNDEMRMQVLRDYWHIALPSIIMIAPTADAVKQDNANRRMSMQLIRKPSVTTAENQTKPPDTETAPSNRLNTRTGRMWKSVGDTYWSVKAEKIRDIIRKERELRINIRHRLIGGLVTSLTDQSAGTIGVENDGDDDDAPLPDVPPVPVLRNKLLTDHPLDDPLIVSNTTLDQKNEKPYRFREKMPYLHLNVDEHVWAYLEGKTKLSISFASDEHPDKLHSSNPHTNLKDNMGLSGLERSPRSRRQSIFQDNPFNGVNSNRRTFALPDPFVNIGMLEFARIKASMNHRDGISSLLGIPTLFEGVRRSSVEGQTKAIATTRTLRQRNVHGVQLAPKKVDKASEQEASVVSLLTESSELSVKPKQGARSRRASLGDNRLSPLSKNSSRSTSPTFSATGARVSGSRKSSAIARRRSLATTLPRADSPLAKGSRRNSTASTLLSVHSPLHEIEDIESAPIAKTFSNPSITKNNLGSPKTVAPNLGSADSNDISTSIIPASPKEVSGTETIQKSDIVEKPTDSVSAPVIHEEFTLAHAKQVHEEWVALEAKLESGIQISEPESIPPSLPIQMSVDVFSPDMSTITVNTLDLSDVTMPMTDSSVERRFDFNSLQISSPGNAAQVPADGVEMLSPHSYACRVPFVEEASGQATTLSARSSRSQSVGDIDTELLSSNPEADSGVLDVKQFIGKNTLSEERKARSSLHDIMWKVLPEVDSQPSLLRRGSVLDNDFNRTTEVPVSRRSSMSRRTSVAAQHTVLGTVIENKIVPTSSMQQFQPLQLDYLALPTSTMNRGKDRSNKGFINNGYKKKSEFLTIQANNEGYSLTNLVQRDLLEALNQYSDPKVNDMWLLRDDDSLQTSKVSITAEEATKFTPHKSFHSIPSVSTLHRRASEQSNISVMSKLSKHSDSSTLSVMHRHSSEGLISLKQGSGSASLVADLMSKNTTSSASASRRTSVMAPPATHHISDASLHLLEENFKHLVDELSGIPHINQPGKTLARGNTLSEALKVQSSPKTQMPIKLVVSCGHGDPPRSTQSSSRAKSSAKTFKFSRPTTSSRASSPSVELMLEGTQKIRPTLPPLGTSHAQNPYQQMVLSPAVLSPSTYDPVTHDKPSILTFTNGSTVDLSVSGTTIRNNDKSNESWASLYEPSAVYSDDRSQFDVQEVITRMTKTFLESKREVSADSQSGNVKFSKSFTESHEGVATSDTHIAKFAPQTIQNKTLSSPLASEMSVQSINWPLMDSSSFDGNTLDDEEEERAMMQLLRLSLSSEQHSRETIKKKKPMLRKPEHLPKTKKAGLLPPLENNLVVGRRVSTAAEVFDNRKQHSYSLSSMPTTAKSSRRW